MSNFTIVTDSSCDMTAAMTVDLDLAVAPLTVSIGGKEYLNLLDGSEISFEDIYSRLRDGETASTSAVNIESFKDIMRPELERGNNILYIGFSSGLSNTYQAGKNACDELAAEFPDRTLYSVDSLCASLGQGMLIYLACKKRDEGGTIEEVRDNIEQTKLHICHWFTVDDLDFLHRGGRVSKTVAIVGSMLNIKPVMHVDNDGRLTPVHNVRGRRAALDALVKHMETTAIDPKNQTIFISHGDCYDDAKYVGDKIKKSLKVKGVEINYVGPVIGSHAGPGTIALFFLGSER